MGLDMYLEVRKFVPAHNYKVVDGDYSKEYHKEYVDILEASGMKSLAAVDSVGLSITDTAIYWRKVNSVHNWFIQNCANGVDECQPVFVRREKLEQLLETVTEAVDTNNPELLPPAEGFFFGSTKIDEWYWNDLKYTQVELKTILDKTKNEDISFIYQASW